MRDDAQLAPDLPRSTFYYAPKPVSDGELALMVLIEMMREESNLYPYLLAWLPNLIFLGLGIRMFRGLSRR